MKIGFFSCPIGACLWQVLALVAFATSSLSAAEIGAPKHIVIHKVDPGAIHLDGDLSEWGSLSEGYFSQQFGGIEAIPDGARNDHAAVKLAFDGTNLMFAARVMDKSVINPHEHDYWRGDCIEVFFDVRPVSSGDGPKFGNATYTEGAYQILLVPPTDDGKPVRWRTEKKNNAAPLEKVEIAGKRLEDGYTLEMRIALENLNRTAPDRLGQPIGFAVMVDDVDAVNGKTTPNCVYQLFDGKNYSNDPSRFFRAALADSKTRLAPFLRAFPARMFRTGPSNIVKAAVFTTADAKEKPNSFELAWRFEGRKTDSERGRTADDKPVKLPEKPDIGSTETNVTGYLPFGVAEYENIFNIKQPAPGRYCFTTKFPDISPEQHVARYYYNNFHGFAFHLIPAETNAPTPFDLILKSYSRIMLATHYPLGRKNVKGEYLLYLSPEAMWGLSEADAQGLSFSLRLDLFPDGAGDSLWHTIFPVGQEKTEFDLPIKGLKNGNYHLKAFIISSAGESRPAAASLGKPPVTCPIQTPLIVGDDRKILLESKVTDAPKLLTKAVKIGDPNRARFPKDNTADCYARSVWDLQLYQGRVYVGCGDWNRNRAPIDIWSFGPASNVAGFEFLKEFTVDDEAVDIFRCYGNELYVPGIDPRESWNLGNLYVKSDGKWTKHRTVPNGIHTLDAAVFQGKLYVTCGTENGAALFESTDGAKTWKHCPAGQAEELRAGRFYEMAVFPDFLLVFPENCNECVFRYTGRRFEKLAVPVYPGLDIFHSRVHRLQRFLDGVVYTLRWSQKHTRPLFFLNDFQKGADMVETFKSENATDILIRGSTCYVLTASLPAKEGAGQDKTQPPFEGCILASRDLKSWTRLARFTVAAAPNSLELMEGVFYVGLSNGGFEATDPASGSIMRIEQ